ncbi:PCI domain-containing protein 2 isoform X6 [Lemur catta]|nr:PCI domain-containing protein 2 isoform X6 [Lemur catta]XP_045422633.1 PCI domain-containing protein 2 isoform X6 [Lemur catta]XP_045422634.1 PCI domain-containing protein 2 isoform X6 [Lemur catta]XP_045422635.1 PCI domain-containing protein 2 isoform X6 [Lemur catta]
MASPEEKCQQVLEPPYDEMFAAHLRCTFAVGNHDFVEAYKCQTVIVQSFLRAFQAHKEENWALPVMYAVALDLRVFANNADQQLVKKGKSKAGDMLEKAAELLMSCFRVCASDTRAGIEDSKKWGMLFLVNQLFKIYFKINKLHLCKPLIRAIDSSNLKDDYSTAQRVTYKYYVGRKAMFDSDFKQAEEYLSFAFEHCHRLSQKNKRMILIYLLPVKMLLGHMPTIELLKKYHLMQFAEVTKAVSEGNLLLLTEALAKHETFFIRCGIFLILEKLKIITYRNLFKKVYLLLRTHQLSLDAFLVALRLMQVEDVDIDEVQCILANLIYMGHIKGYISHQHQKLVVSKQNPFPPLSTAPWCRDAGNPECARTPTHLHPPSLFVRDANLTEAWNSFLRKCKRLCSLEKAALCEGGSGLLFLSVVPSCSSFYKKGILNLFKQHILHYIFQDTSIFID